MVGKTISVRVTGVQGGYLSTSAVSAGTAKAAYPARTAPIAGTWACPTWAPIKGNAESRIYHVPGAAFYDRTNPEKCFRYEADARLAGYRRAQV